MRVHTRTVWSLETGELLADDWFEYSGPVALADRSIANQAGSNAATAGATGGGYGSAASGISGTLIPTLNRELAGGGGLTPTQKNQMLVAANQGSGGAAGGVAGQAGLAAARTRNSGALSGVLDAAARAKAQAGSQAGLNVENKSTDLANQQKAQAASELGGLYGTDVSAQMKAMGLQNQDLDTELNANKSGWLQDTEGLIGTLGNAATSASKAGGFS
jgi:hypothetical protein